MLVKAHKQTGIIYGKKRCIVCEYIIDWCMVMVLATSTELIWPPTSHLWCHVLIGHQWDLPSFTLLITVLPFLFLWLLLPCMPLLTPLLPLLDQRFYSQSLLLLLNLIHIVCSVFAVSNSNTALLFVLFFFSPSTDK